MRKLLTALTAALAALFAVSFAATPTMAAPAPHASRPHASQQAFLTFYGYWDNTPPGSNIAYPQIHQTAGGTGTWADPITFATSSDEVAPGGRIYVPRVGKYFIMEDDCAECDADWTGQGPNGGPNLWHFDLWLGGEGGQPIAAIECENALTHNNPDHTPSMESVIVDPPDNEQVSSDPIFNTETGQCYGGAKPIITVGPYKNTAADVCLDDLGDSSSEGFTLGVKACDGSPEQQFTFDGTFLSIHNLCADSKGGNIRFKPCTGGPTQQWSQNTNGTISDIQTGKKCFRATATEVTAASCSGTEAQWTFPTTVVSPR